MRRRGASDGAAPPPEYLLNLAVWMAEGHSPHPGPAPKWWDHEESYAVFEARRDWSQARQQWFREHDNGTLEMVNALYREGSTTSHRTRAVGDGELLRVLREAEADRGSQRAGCLELQGQMYGRASLTCDDASPVFPATRHFSSI